MTIFFSRFPDAHATPIVVSVHAARDRDAHLVFAWTWNGHGWDQSTPVETPSLQAARALRPPDARTLAVPSDFAVEAWSMPR